MSRWWLMCASAGAIGGAEAGFDAVRAERIMASGHCVTESPTMTLDDFRQSLTQPNHLGNSHFKLVGCQGRLGAGSCAYLPDLCETDAISGWGTLAGL